MKRDARHKTQNLGVKLASMITTFASSKDENPRTEPVTYYGAIKYIIELDYYGRFKFVMFNCDLFEVEEDKYDLTCVYFNRRCYQNDPFVLATRVHQCFYIQDPSEENRHYVMKKVLRDLFNMGNQSNQSNDTELHATNNDGELNWVREDISATVFEKPSKVGEENTFGDEVDDTLFVFMD